VWHQGDGDTAADRQEAKRAGDRKKRKKQGTEMDRQGADSHMWQESADQDEIGVRNLSGTQVDEKNRRTPVQRRIGGQSEKWGRTLAENKQGGGSQEK
jgi:hypothetical protein